VPAPCCAKLHAVAWRARTSRRPRAPEQCPARWRGRHIRPGPQRAGCRRCAGAGLPGVEVSLRCGVGPRPGARQACALAARRAAASRRMCLAAHGGQAGRRASATQAQAAGRGLLTARPGARGAAGRGARGPGAARAAALHRALPCRGRLRRARRQHGRPLPRSPAPARPRPCSAPDALQPFLMALGRVHSVRTPRPASAPRTFTGKGYSSSCGARASRQARLPQRSASPLQAAARRVKQ